MFISKQAGLGDKWASRRLLRWNWRYGPSACRLD